MYTVFNRPRGSDFDIVVVQYQDQGHAPIEFLGFRSGVTVGLPSSGISVDHDTTFDPAGTGQAEHSRLVAVLKLVLDLAVTDKG